MHGVRHIFSRHMHGVRLNDPSALISVSQNLCLGHRWRQLVLLRRTVQLLGWNLVRLRIRNCGLVLSCECHGQGQLPENLRSESGIFVSPKVMVDMQSFHLVADIPDSDLSVCLIDYGII